MSYYSGKMGSCVYRSYSERSAMAKPAKKTTVPKKSKGKKEVESKKELVPCTMNVQEEDVIKIGMNKNNTKARPRRLHDAEAQHIVDILRKLNSCQKPSYQYGITYNELNKKNKDKERGRYIDLYNDSWIPVLNFNFPPNELVFLSNEFEWLDNRCSALVFKPKKEKGKKVIPVQIEVLVS